MYFAHVGQHGKKKKWYEPVWCLMDTSATIIKLIYGQT